MENMKNDQEYFGLTNDIIFGWIMKNDDNCLAIIRSILPELNITKIVRNDSQHDVTPITSSRGVRFDVVVQDDQQRFYDVEMQVENNGDLGKRTRYYQSQIDNETLLKGQSFRDLKESYVIFLCSFDPFGYGLRLYKFHQYEDKHKELQLDTQSHVIFVNAKGTRGKITSDLKAIIDVMNQKNNQDNQLATKLRQEIDYYNQDSRKRREIMDYLTKLEDERMVGQKVGQRNMLKSMITSMNKQGVNRSLIFQIVKDASKGELTDQQVNQLIDGVAKS